MATKALGVLAHVAALRARLWRWDQPGEHTLVATNGSLQLVKKNKQTKSQKTAALSYIRSSTGGPAPSNAT